jgi:hypothetical protein
VPGQLIKADAYRRHDHRTRELHASLAQSAKPNIVETIADEGGFWKVLLRDF